MRAMFHGFALAGVMVWSAALAFLIAEACVIKVETSTHLDVAGCLDTPGLSALGGGKCDSGSDSEAGDQ